MPWIIWRTGTSSVNILTTWLGRKCVLALFVCFFILFLSFLFIFLKFSFPLNVCGPHFICRKQVSKANLLIRVGCLKGKTCSKSCSWKIFSLWAFCPFRRKGWHVGPCVHFWSIGFPVSVFLWGVCVCVGLWWGLQGGSRLWGGVVTWQGEHMSKGKKIPFPVVYLGSSTALLFLCL